MRRAVTAAEAAEVVEAAAEAQRIPVPPVGRMAVRAELFNR